MQKSDSLTKKLAAYSAAATIAVGAGAVHAAGVMRDIPDTTVNVGETLDIDFDNDGNAEFLVQVSSFFTTGYIDLEKVANGGDQGLAVIGTVPTGGYVSALVTGAPINGSVANLNSMAYVLGENSGGPFAGNRAFVGVQFNLDGAGPFYGWIELEVNAATDQAIVYRYYYDDAGAGLSAGQSPTAVAMRDMATTATSNPVGVMALLTGVLSALSGIGVWVRRRVLGGES